MTVSLTNCYAHDNTDYQTLIQPYAQAWKNSCIDYLSTQETLTIADMLLLSYQVVQASVSISQARLTLQQESLNIVTLSINDTFDARMQAQNNDLTAIKQAIETIEHAQDQMKAACNSLKGFGPIIINIDPSVVQIFISHLKDVILQWAQKQERLIDNLEQLQQEVIDTTDLFVNLRTIFTTISSMQLVDHHQLLQGTNSLTDIYKQTEKIISDLTEIRQESLARFNTLLSIYFKTHYQILYSQFQDCITSCPSDEQRLLHPDQVFITQ